ncbi:MAG: LicD family protein [Bacteroidales bacterium]|nr:LicD family protein [Bacteroidales bacterium]
MKELTLKELQSFELDILKDIHLFCLLNSIKYSLYGGSLIGALRHKGFIPWDDDIDIILPRPDYERFVKNYHSDKFEVLYLGNDKSNKLAFARVCDSKKTSMVTTEPWTNHNVGVWIDVFPADGFPVDEVAQKELYEKSVKVRELITFIRKSMPPIDFSRGVLSCGKRVIKKAITLNGASAFVLVGKLNRNIQKYHFGETPYWASLSCVDRRQIMHKHYPIECFRDCISAQFEDTEVMIMNGAETMLGIMYGDWQKLPPVEDRKPKQSYIHFYWKDK